MKILITAILILFTLSSFAQADCNTDEARRALVKTFQINGTPIDWQSVKKNTIEKSISLANRAVRIIVYATNRINTSKIIYKRNTYDLKDTNVCFEKESQELSIQHKDYGTLYIKRKGTSPSNSYIRLQKGKGGFKVYLRTKGFVK